MRFDPEHFDASTTGSDQSERDVLNDLQDERSDAPDLTKSIMGQLGYMQATVNANRKAFYQRWMHRAILGTAAMVALGVGIKLFNMSPEARRPAEITIHEALVNDIQNHSEGLSQLLPTFRTIPTTPESPESQESEVKPEDSEAVEAFETNDAELPYEAKAPFRWI
ncbi:MAG: hypothetical protein O7G85_02810 [Planctomycetota bacterium]|nr:hypothetical protein [Planctomycetota bacterium]